MTQQPTAPMDYQGPWTPQQPPLSQKSFLATWLLAWLLGGLGADRFYLGKIGTGVLKLLTFGGFGIWSLIDLLMTLTGARKDQHGLPLQGYDKHKKVAWVVTGIFVVLGLIIGGVSVNSAPAPQTDNSSIVSEADEAADEAPVADTANEAAVEQEPAEAEPAVEEEPAEESAEEPAAAEEPIEEDPAAEDNDSSVPAEYSSALTKAKSYSDMMHMSKKGLFDQLTSEYGEQFSEDAAQYAVDNVEGDWNQNALEKARSYQDDMAMSPDAIHDQLTSEYGEQFTSSEADYAIDHLND